MQQLWVPFEMLVTLLTSKLPCQSLRFLAKELLNDSTQHQDWSMVFSKMPNVEINRAPIQILPHMLIPLRMKLAKTFDQFGNH
mmetsp:Transcript_8038/g.49647  ORF Transcript_8038/g.49647 Transcript_8038/m.49647 type:complete len:83 (-) Transcript_8038:185-433(-)